MGISSSIISSPDLLPESSSEVSNQQCCLENLFHHITPHTILSNMPQSDTDSLSAFFQIGKVAREKEIQVMCILSVSSIAAAYRIKVVHYLAATIENQGRKIIP
eukprot:2835371-Ditylum_brightwellii.AAC.1